MSRAKDPYETYLRWHKDLKAKGYLMSRPKARGDFEERYKLLKADPSAKNKIRTLARNDIVTTKTGEKKMINELMSPNGNKVFANFFNWDTGHFDLQGMTKRQLYWYIKDKMEEESDEFGNYDATSSMWETQFYRGRGLY